MTYLDQHTQEQITDLVEACTRYWALRGVAWEQCHEMRLELEEHVVQAALDGKALGAVVGPHPAVFAESWAREMHPRVWRGGNVILRALGYALGVVSTTALIQQVLTHASSFPLTLFTAYLLGSFGLLALLIPSGGFLALRIGTRSRRGLLLLAVGTLGALILREIGVRVNWNMALLHWDWPLTILFLVLTAFLFSLDIWRTTKSARFSALAMRRSLARSVGLFVGSVILFDILLFVSSVVVFNSCLLVGRFL